MTLCIGAVLVVLIKLYEGFIKIRLFRKINEYISGLSDYWFVKFGIFKMLFLEWKKRISCLTETLFSNAKNFGAT